MVILSDLSGIFWGVALEGGNKRYTQTTERPVHLSMAAIDPTQQHDDNPVSVMIEQEGNSYVLCNLKYGSLFQQPLDLEFATGETITFYVRGKGVVHLSGYIMPEDEFPAFEADDDDDSDSEAEEASDSDDDDDEEEEDKTKLGKKRPKADSSAAGNKSKKPKLTIDDIESDDDSDDDDFIEDEAEEGSDDSDDDDDDSDEDEQLEDEMDDLEEDSDEDDSEEESDKKAVKSAKKDKKKGKDLNGSKLNETKDSQKLKSKDKVAVVDKTPVAKETKSALPTSTPKLKQEQPSKPATQAQPAAQQGGGGDASTEGKKKKKKNKKKKIKQEDQQGESSPVATSQQQQQLQSVASPSKSSGKRAVQGGVVIEDLKEGHGPEAKLGKTVRVYYTGRLQNGKIFDSSMTGNGFKFKLGKKEVISGWDIGLDGMKVGGKRKLIIPPKMGYGSQSAGGIPPNSTLIFDVELRAVN